MSSDDDATIDERVSRAEGFFRGAVERHATGQALALVRYELGPEVGAGGFGSVHLAHDLNLDRPVAVKLLKQDDVRHRRLLSREAGIASRLEHPNIVPLYDAGVDPSGRPYLAMRYIRGETLRAIIDRLVLGDAETHRCYPFVARCHLLLQLLAALKLAHSRGVLHRDIKPDNIMIGPFGEVFLVDWGIACAPNETGEPGQLSGTARYMSPEQADCEPLDERSDLYSVATVAYELLTLRHPLGPAAPTEAAALAALSSVEPLPAEAVRTRQQRALPRTLSYVVMRGLARDRAERWASAEAMSAAFRVALAGEAPIGCTVTAFTRMLVRIGHALDAHPRLTMTTAATLVGLAAFGLVAAARLVLGA